MVPHEHEEHSAAASVPPIAVAGTACRHCREFLDADDNFCRYCGELTEHGATMVASGKLPATMSTRCPAAPAARPPGWIESPVVILPALFIVLGPLALPMLWHSRRFSRLWKIALTLIVLLVTVAGVWYSVEVVKKTFDPLLQELRLSGLM